MFSKPHLNLHSAFCVLNSKTRFCLFNSDKAWPTCIENTYCLVSIVRFASTFKSFEFLPQKIQNNHREQRVHNEQYALPVSEWEWKCEIQVLGACAPKDLGGGFRLKKTISPHLNPKGTNFCRRALDCFETSLPWNLLNVDLYKCQFRNHANVFLSSTDTKDARSFCLLLCRARLPQKRPALRPCQGKRPNSVQSTTGNTLAWYTRTVLDPCALHHLDLSEWHSRPRRSFMMFFSCQKRAMNIQGCCHFSFRTLILLPFSHHLKFCSGSCKQANVFIFDRRLWNDVRLIPCDKETCTLGKSTDNQSAKEFEEGQEQNQTKRLSDRTL